MTALDELASFVSLVHETFDEHTQGRQRLMQALTKEVSPNNELLNNCINALKGLEVEEEESADDDDMVPTQAR